MAPSSLQLTYDACDLALQSIDVPFNDAQHTDLAVLRTDFISLLSLIYAATTKLALALKPSSPTPSASLTPLKDLSNHVTALSHCARLFDPSHGSTLTQETILAAKDVILAVKALIQTFIQIEATPSPASSGTSGDPYLVRTGAVHEVINNTRSSLSTDNVAAVHKKLAQYHASLDDGLQEVDGIISDQSSPHEESEDNWEDDGWGELGIDSKARMTSEELERTKKTHAVLRLSTLLHMRIIKDVLTSPSGQITLSPHIIQNLDSLPPLSSSLVIACDDLVATLYPPQVPSDISAELAAFVASIDNLHSTLLGLIPEHPLADQLHAMSLQEPGKPQKDPRKWFQLCFAQINRAADSLSSILDSAHG